MDEEISEFYPTHVTKECILGEHMIFFLAFNTLRPDIKQEENKYNIHSLSREEWTKRDTEIQQELNKKAESAEIQRDSSHADIHPENLHLIINRTIRNAFEDTIARKKMRKTVNNTEQFIKQNKDHQLMKGLKEG